MNRHATGVEGERLARGWLRRRGFRILATNWRGGGGELDLVASRFGVLWIVEVKTHARAGPTRPGAAVGVTKQSRLVRAARAYMAGQARSWRRVDLCVVEVTLSPRTIAVIRDAFRADDVPCGRR